MSSKKITELTQAAGITDTDLMLIETTDGTHSIPYSKVKEPLVNDITAVREESQNYYARKEYTYSKTEVDTLISNLTDNFQQKIDMLMDLSVPYAITDFTSSVQNNYITFHFTLPINAKGIKLYSSTNPDVSSTSYEGCITQEFNGGKYNNWTLGEENGFTVGTKYYFVIYTYNNKGDSSASDIISNTLKPPQLNLSNYSITGEWKITGDRFNLNNGMYYPEENMECIGYHKEAEEHFDDLESPSSYVETENTLQEMFGKYDYSDSTLHIYYSLDTDCPEEKLSRIAISSNGFKLLRLDARKGENLWTISNPYEFKNYISNHLNEKFNIAITLENSWESGEYYSYYFNLTINAIYFDE